MKNTIVKIGHGSTREMLVFRDEVQQQIKENNLKLEVLLEELTQEKYGEIVRSKFSEVKVSGTNEEIQKLIDLNK